MSRLLVVSNRAPVEIERTPHGVRMTRTGPRGDRAADERTWAYGRARRPCLRCGTPIVTAVQGEQLRRTYYCPVCQK